jgi:multimeric flavodoxin WrbA
VKRLLGICTSPRRAATWRALELALEAAAGTGKVETEFLAFKGRDIKSCNHCNYCKREKQLCIIKDDMTELYPRIMAADAYLFASPVYAMNATPAFHAFSSRLRPLMANHPETLRNKPAACIAVGGKRNGGQETTIASMIHALLTRGMLIVGNEPFFYSGGMVWSRDQGAEGMEADTEGMDSIRLIGQRIAEVCSLL